jgi:hypothetical protein
VARKAEGPAGEYPLTNADWGTIHKLAWQNAEKVQTKDADGKEVERNFGDALATDPTAAIRHYALKYKKLKSNFKMVKLRPPPADVPEEFWDDVNPFPPSCC